MIVLYDKNKADNFTTNDLVLKNISKCEVIWEKNGQYQINLIYPIIGNDTLWENIVKDAIVKCPVAYQDDQLFRLGTPTKKFDNGYFYIEVTGYHISYDLGDNFLEDVVISNLSGVDAGNYILNNTQYKHPFVWSGDISTINSAEYARQNVIDALIGGNNNNSNNNSYVDLWGGELVRDNFNIGMFKNGGINRGVSIKYSKNLTGLDQSGDDSNLVTRAMPTIPDNSQSSSTTNGIKPVVTIPEKYVDSPLINNYPHPYVKEVQVTLTTDQQNLPLDQQYGFMRDYVNNLYSGNHIDVPVYSYTVNFINLSQTQEYKDYAILEEVHPMDLVTVKALDIDIIAENVAYTFNSLNKKYESITLGNVQNDILRHNNKSLFQISADNSNNIQSLQAQIVDLPNAIVSNPDNHMISGGNNLFDHSLLSNAYIPEWTNSGATVITDNTLHDTNLVWQAPPNASLNKNAVINNPDTLKGQQLVFSLQAKYSGVNLLNGGEYQQSPSNALLGALDMQVKRCLADGKSSWGFNKTGTGLITDYIAVDEGTEFVVTNTQSYYYVLHGYDNSYTFVTDFTAEPAIPDNVSFMTVEIIQTNITPMNILGFNIYELNSRIVKNVAAIYADKTDSDWQTHEQSFYINTDNPSDTIEAVNFTSSNNDSTATIHIGAFMINSGNTRSDYSQSSNDTVETLAIHTDIINNTIGDAPYRVQIVSTNGAWFRNGQVDTTLSAIVFLGFNDVTSTIDSSRFVWSRMSNDTNADATWNTAHIGCGKQIHITKDDLTNKATMKCDILSQ